MSGLVRCDKIKQSDLTSWLNAMIAALKDNLDASYFL